MRNHILTAGLLALAGCASTPAVRDLSDRTGVFVTSLNTGTAEFIETQERLNAANETRLDELGRAGLDGRAGPRQQQLAWRDAGEARRLATADAATSTTPEQIVTSLSRPASAPARIPADVLGGYSKTLQSLAAVSAKPKAGAAVQEIVAFGGQVHDQYVALREAATEKSKATSGTAAGATKADVAAGAAAVAP